MSRIVYVNGAYLPLEDAKISIMDRGFLFADGIYEVTAVIDGAFVDNEPHLNRLNRCLREIDIESPHSIEQWTAIQKELVKRNNLVEGLVYIEVTRGVFERDFVCPKDLKPTVVMFTQTKQIKDAPAAREGAAIITVPDLRWKRRDIKSVALLAQVLAKQAAREAGVAEAWMVENDLVTEGASSTAFIVSEGKRIVTRPLSTAVLPGITRRSVMALAERHGLSVEERAFSVEEAYRASEAFYTSASSLVMPVVKIDERVIGSGRPGPLATDLRRLYLDLVPERPVAAA